MQVVNIVIALSRPEESTGIRNILSRNGYRSVFICANGAQAISQMDELDGGIIICGYKLQDMMYTELLGNLPYGFEMLMLIQQKHAGECDGNGVRNLVVPLKSDVLVNTLNDMAYEQLRRRKRERQRPKARSEEDKRIIEEAKELIMKRKNMTEEEAHRYIQKSSMESGNGMVETAQMVLAVMKQHHQGAAG